MPIFILYFTYVLMLMLALPVNAAFETLSLTELEQRLVDIDSKINQLAPLNLRGGAGSIGFRATAHESRNQQDWVQVDLGKEVSIDEIVLVPCLWRSTNSGFAAEGFPLGFQVIAGCGDEQGRVIASFTEADGLLPRIAPVVIPCSRVSASWLRIQTTHLSRWSRKDEFIFQLSELLVFKGEENVALGRPVTSSSVESLMRAPWACRFLTDGFVPYLMDSPRGKQSNAYVSSLQTFDSPSLTIDLKEIHSISRINLHAVELGDTVPQSNISDFGMPGHLQIEAATEPDFSDAVLLVDYEPSSHYEIGPIKSWNFPETRCRYFRLTALEPYLHDLGTKKGSRIGFAEIEVFSGSKNVALGMPVQTSYQDKDAVKKLSALTDGQNFYGEILPIRQWLTELALRHELEAERPDLITELGKRYAHQKTNLYRLGWLTAILTIGIGFTILVDRLIRLRQVAHIKERLAADLHDELGANIHSIGMLSDIAQDLESPAEWKLMHHRILKLSKRSSKALRYCSNMMEADGLYIGLIEDMERAARRIGGNFKHELTVSGEPELEQLKPRARIDLFLFYKEALVNVCRHASATQVHTQLTATTQEVCLIVTDNGQGRPDTTDSTPTALERRAHLMGAKVTAQNILPEGGTRITLTLILGKHNLSRWFRRVKLIR